MASILPYIQIILSVLLVIGVLIQYTSAGLGGAFGGSDSVDAGFHTRRGPEQIVFIGTFVIAFLLVASIFVSLQF